MYNIECSKNPLYEYTSEFSQIGFVTRLIGMETSAVHPEEQIHRANISHVHFTEKFKKVKVIVDKEA